MKSPSDPWEPDEIAQGARVRIRLSGECPGWGIPSFGLKHHPDSQHGKIGTVAYYLPLEFNRIIGDGHAYEVMIDGETTPRYFARIELERVP